jgi:hypothetical protein
LRTGQGFVGCCAADEGLVDLGAEEGAVAFEQSQDGYEMGSIWRMERMGLPEDVEWSEVGHFDGVLPVYYVVW